MSASDRPLGDLIEEIAAGKLIVRPGFQRRLVWTNKDKEYFIETVLRGLPFPEIFICTGDRDTKRSRTTLLVDGQQRMSTLRDYVAGSAEILYKTVPKFENLTPEQKESFLETRVAVRDLQRVSQSELKEIFTRINSTNYMLKSMEKRNALFSGELKQYCDALSEQPFFTTHKVFSDGRKKRMEDLAFCVILVSTILGGYFHRDSKNAEFLERYNDDFPEQDRIQSELDAVFAAIEQCGFDEKSEIWKPTHLFTIIVELYQVLFVNKSTIAFEVFRKDLENFYADVKGIHEAKGATSTGENDGAVFGYWKASRTAANDKHSRVKRAEIISEIISRSVVKAECNSPPIDNSSDATRPKKKSQKRPGK